MTRASGIAAARPSQPQRAGAVQQQRHRAVACVVGMQVVAAVVLGRVFMPAVVPQRGEESRLDDSARRRRVRVARIRRTRGLDEQEVRLLFRHGAVLHALGHHEHLARAKRDVAVVHADRELAAQDEEEVVRVVVLVPVELTLDLDDHQIVPVELADDSGLPMLRERGELLGEVGGLNVRSGVRFRYAMCSMFSGRITQPCLRSS